MIEAYILHLLILISIYIILSAGLNLALGYTGLLNLGHVAFIGIGAYTSAILVKSGSPFIIAFIAAGIIPTFAAYFLVYSTRKLKGDYLALATLGFTFIINSLLLNLAFLTRGPMGIAGIPKPSFFGLQIASNFSFFIFSSGICLASLFILYLIVKSPFGRLLQAVRDDELGLLVLGKDTFKLKYKSLMISAFFAGIGGSLFAHYISFIEPSSFMIGELILILTIVIVGGIASMRGTIIATFVIILLPEFLRFLSLPSSVIGPARLALYAVILLVILLFRPRGILGKVDLE